MTRDDQPGPPARHRPGVSAGEVARAPGDVTAAAATMIADILPRGVAAAEATDDRRVEVLFPGELALVSRAVQARQREFATGRWCARQALAHLGVAPAPILMTERGAPVWPHDIVGSITHCDGYRAAAVARGHDVATIGIDAEPHAPLPNGVFPLVAREEERHQHRRLQTMHPQVHWDRVLFSAKESAYKAWHPLTGRWLDFQEVHVLLGADGTFSARLAGIPSCAPGDLPGRWCVHRQLLLTAIAALRQ